MRDPGHDWIEARSLGELPPDELRLIELEENLQRKDLTAFEKSKMIVETVKVVKDALKKQAEFSLESSKKSTGGRPPKADSEEKVGESIGVPRQTISEAEKHVAIAEQYPFMESWPQYRVLEAAELMENLPEDERVVAETMFSEPAMPPSPVISMLFNLLKMSAEQRGRIWELYQSDDSSSATLCSVMTEVVL